MYRRADDALYRAKSAGKNRYVIFDPVQVTAYVSNRRAARCSSPTPTLPAQRQKA